MLLPLDNVSPLSFGGPQHEGRSSVLLEDPGDASPIMLELCTIVHGPAPRPRLKQTRRFVHCLARKSQDIFQKLFEVEFPSDIDVVAGACFGELHC